MSELSERIRKTLSDLHAELANVDPQDADVKDLLVQAAAEIEGKLNPTAVVAGETPAAGPSLEDRLAEAARHFEVNHPAVAGMISTLSNTLSQLGI